MTLPHRQRDHVLTDAAAREDRDFRRAGSRLDRHHIPFGDTELLRYFVIHFQPGLPGNLGDRIGNLLQPRQSGTPPIVEEGRRLREQHEIAVAFELRIVERDPRRAALYGAARSRHCGKHASAAQGLAPVGVSPRGLENLPEASLRKLPSHVITHGTTDLEQAVSERLGVIERSQGGLDDRTHTRARSRIAPGLERGVVRENEVREFAGLIGEGRKGDDQIHLLQGVGKAELGQRVDRIAAVQHEHVYPTGAHVFDQLLHVCVARVIANRHEVHTLADGTQDGVEKQHRGIGGNGVGALEPGTRRKCHGATR